MLKKEALQGNELVIVIRCWVSHLLSTIGE